MPSIYNFSKSSNCLIYQKIRITFFYRQRGYILVTITFELTLVLNNAQLLSQMSRLGLFEQTKLNSFFLLVRTLALATKLACYQLSHNVRATLDTLSVPNY